MQAYLGILPYKSNQCNTVVPAEGLIDDAPEESILTKSIRLSINGDSFEVGLARDDEVYLPWSWIEPYFDVYGHLDKNNDIFYFTNANR